MDKFMDNFHEEIIVRKNKGLFNLLYVLGTILMFVFALVAAFNLAIVDFTRLGSFDGWMPLIIMLVTAGIALLLYWGRNFARIDYEYSFTNGSVDVAKVVNNRARKEMLSFKAKDIEIMAPVMTNGFERYQSMNDIKTINAWLNRDRVKYFAVFRYNEQKTMLIFEPSPTMVKLFKKYNVMHVKDQ